MHEILERRCVNLDRDVNAGIEKRRLSDEIAAQTEAFLKSGGKINEVPSSSFIVFRKQVPLVISDVRQSAMLDKVAKIPESLRSKLSESGWIGIMRDKNMWRCRWDGKRFGRFATVNLAAQALLRHLDSIGYKYE